MAEVKTVISVNGIDGVTLAGSSSHRQPEQDALALVPVKSFNLHASFDFHLLTAGK